MTDFDVAIIGAGAAGLMCAITAGQRGRRVLLLEHNREPGAKILISGGGRCNFTNLDVSAANFISNSPHFCKSALSRYAEHDFIALVEKHRIRYHEKTLGQLFCDGSAREILAMLLNECAANRVDLRCGYRVRDVAKNDRFRIETNNETFTADALVLATGGLSIPKMGASSLTYDIARRLGLSVIEPRPGLVPLTFESGMLEFCRALSGVSTEAVVTCGRTSFRESILFTHRGLSGPAILQISSYWREGDALAIDLTPTIDAETLLKDRKRTRPKAELKTILGELLPARLANAIADSFAPGPIASLSDRAIVQATERLKRWHLVPSGSEGFAKAEVTTGGVDTDELSSKTMESRKVPGLYVIGEAVDVTGWLGGYNFQWAWSSGWSAGQAI